MASELTPIPHEQVTPGWWYVAYGDEGWIFHFRDPHNYSHRFLAPIPSVELCRFLHDAGITTVEQLEAWRHGR